MLGRGSVLAWPFVGRRADWPWSDPLDPKLVEPFITRWSIGTVSRGAGLETLFGQVERSERVLAANLETRRGKPAQLSPHLRDPERIRKRRGFLETPRRYPGAGRGAYGVAPEVLVAIVGGRELLWGQYRRLSRGRRAFVPGFYFPSRSPFFTSELEAFLLMTRDQDLDRSRSGALHSGAHGNATVHPDQLPALCRRFRRGRSAGHLAQRPDVLASVANYFKSMVGGRATGGGTRARDGRAYQPLLYAGKARRSVSRRSHRPASCHKHLSRAGRRHCSWPSIARRARDSGWGS